jgi:hypothetical protein
MPAYSNVRRGGGCRVCATSGFNPVAPAIVYLIVHERLGAAKVGVAGLDTGRLELHRNEGWEVVGTWDVDYGRRAEEIEAEVIRWWRDDLGAAPAITGDQMPQGRRTETASLNDVSLEETARRVWRLVAES